MRLIRLKLENFRQHAQTEVFFDEGMTAIVGPNGAGKSTLLEAITFALYGKQRDTQDTIRFFWGDKKKYLVELEFEFDGRRLVVQRGTSDASLCDLSSGSSVPLAVGLSDTRIACERLLGLSYEQFKNSFSTVQKELAFLAFANSKKQDEVGRMLGFDRVQKAEELARARRSELKTLADAMLRSLGNLDELQKTRERDERELAALQAKVEENKCLLTELETKLPSALALRKEGETYLKLTQEMKALGAKAEALKSAKTRAAAALKDAEARVKELSALRKDEQEYRRLEKEVSVWEERRTKDQAQVSLKTRLEALQGTIRDLDERIGSLKAPALGDLAKALKAAMEKRDRHLKLLSDLEKQWRDSVGAANKLHAAAEAVAKQAKSALARCEAMAAKGLCPECGQAIGKGYQEILDRAKAEEQAKRTEAKKAAEAATHAAAIPDALKAAQTELEPLTRAAKEAEQNHAQASALHEQAQFYTADRAARAAEAAKIEATLANTPLTYDAGKHQSARAAMDPLEANHLRFQTLRSSEEQMADRKRESEEAAEEYNAAKAGYKQLESERKELRVKTEEQAERAVEDHRTLESGRATLTLAAVHYRDLDARLRKGLAETAKQIEEQRKRALEYERAKEGAALHEIAAKELQSLRAHLNQTIRPDLEARAAENLNLLTNGRYSTIDLDKEFEAKVIEDGVPKAVISGGEEDVVALALRLALSELIQERQGRPMALLILDEVFGSLDAERRQSVLERLAALKGRFRQIIVISHIEEINQVADRALFVRQDERTRMSVVTDAPPDCEDMSDLGELSLAGAR